MQFSGCVGVYFEKPSIPVVCIYVFVPRELFFAAFLKPILWLIFLVYSVRERQGGIHDFGVRLHVPDRRSIRSASSWV